MEREQMKNKLDPGRAAECMSEPRRRRPALRLYALHAYYVYYEAGWDLLESVTRDLLESLLEDIFNRC